MHRNKRINFLILLLITSIGAHAQTVNPEANDFMRSNGKIYVVVAVVITILAGLFVYVFSLDRKISKLEKGK